MEMTHENAVAMSIDLYTAYRAAEGEAALEIAEQIPHNNAPHAVDEVLVSYTKKLIKLAREVDYIIDEFSALVVRGEEENTFDVFLLDEDQLYISHRKNVKEEDIETAYRQMGLEWRKSKS